MLQMGLKTHLSRPHLVRLLEDEFRRLEGHIDKASAHLTLQEATIRLLGRYRDRLCVDSLAIAAQDVGAIARALMGAAVERGESDWDAVIDRAVRAMLGYLGAPWTAQPDEAMQIAS
jgi:hypothetical protein